MSFGNNHSYSIIVLRAAVPLDASHQHSYLYFTQASPACTVGEIPVFLGCPDVDPMHSQKLDIVAAFSSLYLNNLAS